jgi:pimeloyl-ACP methyl ester carboxylesterase
MPETPLDDYGNPDPEWLRIDWRPHVHQVELPGATVNYAETGEGEPVVFVHGISGSWQNWLENLPHFGRTRRAIALDLPGFGASPMPAWPIDMHAYGQLLHDFCEKLGIDRGATVVGNSMGGLVAAAGLLNTWLPHQRGTATSHAWGTFGPGFGKVAREVVTHKRTRYAMFRFFMRHPGRLRKELLWEQMASGLPAPGFADALDAVIEYDARHRLEEIEIPVMIVWGTDDWVIPSVAAHSYNRRIPHSRLEIFEETGHVPQMERPARFNALLDEFLNS